MQLWTNIANLTTYYALFFTLIRPKVYLTNSEIGLGKYIVNFLLMNYVRRLFKLWNSSTFLVFIASSH